MKSFVTALLSLAATITVSSSTPISSSSTSVALAPHYAQCGGSGFTGPTACVSPYVCVKANDFFSTCQSVASSSSGLATSTSSTSTVPIISLTSVTSSSSVASVSLVPHYAQCGGQTYIGPTVCASPYVCVKSNEFFSTCQSIDSSSSGLATSTSSTSVVPISSSTPVSSSTPISSSTSVTSSSSVASVSLAPHYAQCGGIGFTGPTACVSPYVCIRANDYFSTCQTTDFLTTSTSTSSTLGPGPYVAHYGQCGGMFYTGPLTCAPPYSCIVTNAYFSSCL